ncbi:MAG: succinylglutamate desuccinylase/aspartoacylase family protein [Candidatus Hydrogenedentes bacterium]|nr:succinylglutamate desuccinylase/aspartoacylase family protein [Candidatus Hydrogenedentota bacterium]
MITRKDPATTRIRYSFLKILTGSDLSRRRLPLMAAESVLPGPVVWLTACAHGDEVGGIIVIQEVFKRIRRHKLLRGSVLAFPLMNPIGFETATRNITVSQEDLNRSFPGDQHGSLGERIAHRISSYIVQTQPALVLDLHNDWMNSIPYTVLDPDPGTEHRTAYEVAVQSSLRSGFLVIQENEPLQTTLSGSLLQQNIPALTLELGGSYVVHERNITHGLQAVWGLLSALEVVRPLDGTQPLTVPEGYADRVLHYSDRPYSSSSGIIRFLARPGDRVTLGQPIAEVYNAFGKMQERLVALNDSIVLGHADSSVVFPGMPVMAFGIG